MGDDVFLQNIWPRIAKKLRNMIVNTPLREARLAVGTMFAMRRVNHEWMAVLDSFVECAALRATMILAFRFERRDRMRYLQLHLRGMISLLGRSTLVTVEHDSALLGGIAGLSNRQLYGLVRLLRRSKRNVDYFTRTHGVIPHFGFYNSPTTAA